MRRDRLLRWRKQARDGFTFAELLLVLALLLIVTGLVFPPVLRMMADQPLKEGAERARTKLANTRLKALDHSAAWQFRFEPGGRRYLWMPMEPIRSGRCPGQRAWRSEGWGRTASDVSPTARTIMAAPHLA